MKHLIPAIFGLVIGASAWGADHNILTPEPHRITDEAIAADIRVIQGLQKRLADLNGKGTPIASYHFAKAQAWLDFAMDEYTINDRSRVVEEALHQALSLVERMEEGKKDIGMATPIIPTSLMVRPDLWEKAELLKKKVGPTCAGDKIAQLEVQLVWAGHEEKEFDWRHAKPYLQAAERLANEAAAQMAACPPEPPEQKSASLEPATINTQLSAAMVEQMAKKGEPSAVIEVPPAANIEAAVAQSEHAIRMVTTPANNVTVTPQSGSLAPDKVATPPATPVVATLPVQYASVQTKCPEPTIDIDKALGSLPDGIHFAVDRADISEVSARVLDRVAAVLKKEPTVRIMLQGHADQRGQFSYNLDLSGRRAKSVRSYLIAKGIASERIDITALGEANPLVQEKTIDGYAWNRVVKFIFTTSEPLQIVPQMADLQPERTQ